jgi:hypothetical protein
MRWTLWWCEPQYRVPLAFLINKHTGDEIYYKLRIAASIIQKAGDMELFGQFKPRFHIWLFCPGLIGG